MRASSGGIALNLGFYLWRNRLAKRLQAVKPSQYERIESHLIWLSTLIIKA
jgi:hypothetical protein